MGRNPTGALVFGSLVVAAPLACAAALPAAQTALEVRAGGGAGFDRDVFRGTGYHAVSASGTLTAGTFVGSANASAAIQPTFAGPVSPVAIVDASASWPCCGSTGGVFGTGTASFVYYTQIAAIAPLPPGVPAAMLPVPFVVTDYVSASVSGPPPPQGGGGSAQATATVARQIGNVSVLSDHAAASLASGGQTNSKTVAASGFAGEVFVVTLAAGATASAGGSNYGGTAAAHAVADPRFEFDQAAFDLYSAQHGFASFPLASHFVFDYSAGVAVVPEPQTWALLLAGLAGIATRGGRRFNVRILTSR